MSGGVHLDRKVVGSLNLGYLPTYLFFLIFLGRGGSISMILLIISTQVLAHCNIIWLDLLHHIIDDILRTCVTLTHRSLLGSGLELNL